MGEEFQIGYGQLRLQDLQFEMGREVTDEVMRRLVSVIKHRCDPHLPSNHIPIVISPTELHTLIAASGITLESLSPLQPGPYPKLIAAGKVNCLHGRQRYAAALKVYGPQMWWTVKIFCIPAGCDPMALLRREIDQHYFQAPPSDGEVFVKVRFYEKSRQPDLAIEWRLRLSPYKNKALNRLLGKGLPEKFMTEHQRLVDALDRLLVFPGLWYRLELGNVEKLLALHMLEEMVTYLDNMYSVWSGFTLCNPVIQGAVDLETVEKLELRAPRASSVDRIEVQRMMRTGVLFKRVSDSDLRQKIEASILQTSGLIPSFRTFHEDTSYLGIGTTIVKSHVLGGLGRGESVYYALSKIWQPPPCCILEHQDGEFQETAMAACPRIAYQQLVIAALRNFPKLSNVKPRCERGENPMTAFKAEVDSRHVRRLLFCAQALGFNSQHIKSRLTEICVDEPISSLPKASLSGQREEVDLKRRCGRPFTASFNHFFQSLFLPQLVNLKCAPTAFPSTLFVQRSIICPFFKNTPSSLPCYVAPAAVPLLNLQRVGTSTRSQKNSLQIDEVLNNTWGNSPESTSRRATSFPQDSANARILSTAHESTHQMQHDQPARGLRNSGYRTIFWPKQTPGQREIAATTGGGLSWHSFNEVDLGHCPLGSSTPPTSRHLAGRSLFDPNETGNAGVESQLAPSRLYINDQMQSSATWAQRSRGTRPYAKALSSDGGSEAASFALSTRSIWRPSPTSGAPLYITTASHEGNDAE